MEKDKKWYVAYTYPRAEKKVNKRIKELGVETFFPTQIVKKKWSDRIKEIETPLFPNYIFAKAFNHQIGNLLSIDGLSRFISFGGQLATIREQDIEMIKKILRKKIYIEKSRFRRGQKVVIKVGPLSGLEGILIKEDG